MQAVFKVNCPGCGRIIDAICPRTGVEVKTVYASIARKSINAGRTDGVSKLWQSSARVAMSCPHCKAPMHVKFIW